MAVGNINQVRGVGQAAVQRAKEAQEQRRRLDLHVGETFEKHRGADFKDLSSFTLPVSDDEKQTIAALFASVAPDDRQRLSTASVALASALMSPGAVGPSGETSAGLRNASSAAMATFLVTKGADHAAEVTKGFTAMALAGMEHRLQGFAGQVKQNGELVRQMRTDAAELRDMLSDWPQGETREFTWREASFDENGKATVVEHKEVLTREQAKGVLDRLETQIQSANEVSQTMQFDLQRLYEDYQRGVQTLTTIIKDAHDDAMKVLNNLRA